MKFNKENEDVLKDISTQLIPFLKNVMIEDENQKVHNIKLYTFELDENINQLQISINEYFDKDKEGNPTYAVHIDIPI